MRMRQKNEKNKQNFIDHWSTLTSLKVINSSSFTSLTAPVSKSFSEPPTWKPRKIFIAFWTFSGVKVLLSSVSITFNSFSVYNIFDADESSLFLALLSSTSLLNATTKICSKSIAFFVQVSPCNARVNSPTCKVK